MSHMSNIEPRRVWSRSRFNNWLGEDELDWEADFDNFQLGMSRCTTCGATSNLRFDLGPPFCRDCVEWSRAANLDPDYDDIGLVD